MAWFAELAGKAEHLLNNLDEQTGAALRSHRSIQTKKSVSVRNEGVGTYQDPVWKKPKVAPKPPVQQPRKWPTNVSNIKSEPPKKLPVTNHGLRLSTERNKSPEKYRFPEKCKKEIVVRKTFPSEEKGQFNFEDCPRTLVHDWKENNVVKLKQESKQRRYSFPGNLTENENVTYKIQNLDVENAMLKNELNVVNQEISELHQRLRVTEEEYQRSQQETDNLKLLYKKIDALNDELAAQVGQLKSQVEAHQHNELEMKKQTEHSLQLEYDVELLRDTVKDLEAKLRDHDIKRAQSTTHNVKLENDLRHAHSAMQDLQEALDKSTGECYRLERDWETYKVRVKNMLAAKDNEIKSLQAGMNLTEDTKILMEQIDSLIGERDDLTLTISNIRREYEDMRECLMKLESRSSSSERLVAALRAALKEERTAKNQLEKQYLALSLDIKSIQSEYSKTIALLKAAVTEKEVELSNLRESVSTTTSQETSTLNVGDYEDLRNESLEKIEFLTEKLVQRQENVDKLLADNNMLRIQLESLECKHKSELASLKNHSVVNLDVDTRPRGKSSSRQIAENSMNRLSLRIGVFIRRYPIFRLFIIVYMIGLHAWVSTVLFTNAPDILPKPNAT